MRRTGACEEGDGSTTSALGTQKTGGVLKSDAIRGAAAALTAVGASHAEDIEPGNATQKRAYTSVKGLGWVTWEYLGMLLGRPGVKPDQWVIQAVSNAVDRPVPAREAQDIVLAAAKDMKQHATRPEHALWAYERKRPKDRSR